MNTTYIIAKLIERGLVVEDFYNSGVELSYDDDNFSIIASVKRESFEISVRDREEEQIVMSLDVIIEYLTNEQFEAILKLAGSLASR